MSDNKWIKDYLEKMDGKLDKLEAHHEKHDARLDNIDITLAKQSVVLEEHHRRSLANEEAVEVIRNELKPIQHERYMVKGAAKLLGALLAAGGVLGGIVKCIFYLYH